MRHAALALVLIGCATSPPSAPGAPGSGAEPRTCGARAALAGGDGPITVGPFAVAGGGTDVCVHLDASAAGQLHFTAATPIEAGPTTALQTTLEDATFAPVLDGWDVTVGQTDPHSFMNLEWDPPVGQVLDVVVWLRAQPGTAPSALQLSLVPPLE